MSQDHNMTVLPSALEEITGDLLKEIKLQKEELKIKIREVKSQVRKIEKESLNYNFINEDDTKEKSEVIEDINSRLQTNTTLLKSYEGQLTVLNKKEQDYIRLNSYITEKTNRVDRQKELCKESNGLQFLEIQEVERQRIARELHDSTVQNLTNLVHVTELCSKLIDMDPIRAKLELQIMSNTIKTTINDMREIIYDLRPMSLEDLGLITTIKRYIQQFVESSTCHVEFCVTNEKPIDRDIIDLTLFRVIQEACNNSIKHANPSLITIHLNYYKSYIELIIKDNGKGFDLKKSSKNADTTISKTLSNFGLSMMKERVALLSGKITITSELNKGTNIKVCVPVNFRNNQE